MALAAPECEFTLIINRSTTAALRLKIPQSLLVRAGEVID